MIPSPDTLVWAAPWAVVDLETDGVDPAEAMPCEIAVARFEGGDLVGAWSSFLNPGRPMSDEVIKVHGITNAMVAEAPPAGAAIELIRNDAAAALLFEGAYPVGYNGQGYDRAILQRIDLRRGFDVDPQPPWLSADWIDPLVIVRDIDRFVAGSGRHRLAVTCARHKVEHVDAHRAFGDCAATGRLLWKLRDRIGELTIGKLLAKQRVRAEVQEREFQAWLARQPKRERQPA